MSFPRGNESKVKVCTRKEGEHPMVFAEPFYRDFPKTLHYILKPQNVEIF